MSRAKSAGAAAALLAVVALFTTAATTADGQLILESGERPFRGPLASEPLGMKANTSIGQVFCLAGRARGVVEHSQVSGRTDVGWIEAMSFTGGSTRNCEDAIDGVSSCRYTLRGLPYRLSIDAASKPTRIVVDGLRVRWRCLAFGFAPFTCDYAPQRLSAPLDGAHARFDAILTAARGAPSGCVAQFALEFELPLRSAAGRPVSLRLV